MRRILHLPWATAVLILFSPPVALSQPDSVATDTLVKRIYLKIIHDPNLDIPDEIVIKIFSPETTQAIASRVTDEIGVPKSEWAFDVPNPVPLPVCKFRPFLEGFKPEAIGRPGAEFDGDEWVGRYSFRFDKIWRAVVESDPEGLQVFNLNLESGDSTSYTTPAMPWDETLKLEFRFAGEFSYWLALRADDLIAEGGIKHNKKKICKSIIKQTSRNMSLAKRCLIDKKIDTDSLEIRLK